jgi:hypothetical protein
MLPSLKSSNRIISSERRLQENTNTIICSRPVERFSGRLFGLISSNQRHCPLQNPNNGILANSAFSNKYEWIIETESINIISAIEVAVVVNMHF